MPPASFRLTAAADGRLSSRNNCMGFKPARKPVRCEIEDLDDRRGTCWDRVLLGFEVGGGIEMLARETCSAGSSSSTICSCCGARRLVMELIEAADRACGRPPD